MFKNENLLSKSFNKYSFAQSSYPILIKIKKIVLSLIAMSNESKYYYIKPVNTYSSDRWRPHIIKWNKYYYVEVDENVEYNQSIDVTIDELGQNNYVKPKSSEYEKAKPILEDLFLEYYNLSLKYIADSSFDEGEIYLIKNSNRWYQIEYYSKNEKDKRRLIIDFRDSIEGLWLRIYNTSGFKGRPYARKNGSLITNEKFKQFYNLTLKFLSDSNSYKIYLESYLKNFYGLARGDKTIEVFDVTADKSFKDILKQLEERKSIIEKQLIEIDSDSKQDRIKLRGELDGINYAISTINIHK